MGDILIKLHQDSLFCTVINMFYNQRVYDQEKKIYIYIDTVNYQKIRNYNVHPESR